MPQHTKRTRFRRKELRQPDEFETLTARGLAWVQERQQLALALLAGGVGVAILALIVSRVGAARTAAAGEAFRSAYATFEGGKFSDAEQAFAGVARDYGRTPFGKLAALYRGHAFARQSDPTSAVTAYGEYLTTSPESYLRQEALVGLGHAKEASGDAPGALTAYTEAGTLDGPFRTDALLSTGRLHEADGHQDQAREIYQGLVKDTTDPDLRALLQAKLPPGSQVPADAPAAPPTP